MKKNLKILLFFTYWLLTFQTSYSKTPNIKNYCEKVTGFYGPLDTGDYKLAIYNATASSFQPGSEIQFSFDGNLNTIYHSNWNGDGFPISLAYNLLNTSEVNYMIYYPRMDGGSNGKFGETEIWYAKASNPQQFIKVMDYDFQYTDTARRIDFATSLKDVVSMRIIVNSGYGNFASCAEMEFYSKNPPPQRKVYVAGNTDNVVSDKVEIGVTGGSASNFEPGNNFKYSYDNDFTTLYHSDWDGGGFPITLTYKLAQTNSLDYMEYYPRQDGGNNGNFGEFELFYSTQNAPATFVSLGNYDFGGSPQASLITFKNALINPASIRLIVHSGENNFASCAEMKFFKKNTSVISNVFADAICSKLQTWVTQSVIDTMSNAFYKNIAQNLFTGKYQKQFRVQSYQPYPTVETTASQLKLSTYNSFENPTGIVFKQNEEVVIFVDTIVVKPIQLKVVNMVSGNTETSTYLLNSGINKITPQTEGLGYISYYYDDYKNLPNIKMNIAGGTVNGYFDIHKHTNADWRNFLKNTVYSSFDILGKEVNLCYDVAALRNYADDGISLINLYDSIIHMEHDQMGLIKYKRLPKNHQFGYSAPNGGYYAGGLGAHFDLTWGPASIAGVNGIRTDGIWGIAHEFGHVNQIRPDIRWLGTTEVTNNIYSLWCSRQFGSNHTTKYRLETETIDDGYGNNLAGGRINSFLNEGIIKGKPWQFQMNGDPFVKLTPLWQIMIYYQLAGKGNDWYKPDWFKDLAERARNTNSDGISNGQLQLNFMKNTCDMVKQDLTDFFKKSGMLQPIDTTIDDYGEGRLTITQTGCDSVVVYASKYPKPASPVIYYLSINSLDAFQHKAAIEGTNGNGYTLNGTKLTIDHNKWKNVAAFETYKNDSLERAAIYGTGSADDSFTIIELPDTAVRIYAVGWDGSKKLVYPKDGVLAVNPLVLKVNKVDNKPILNWSIINESDIIKYQIERSFDGRSYSSLSIVTSNGSGNYMYKDVDAAKNSITYFYRIKSIDNQGKAGYSNIQSIILQTNVFTVYPVPFVNIINVQLADNLIIEQIKLINLATGVIVNPAFKQQYNQVKIQASNVQKGAYLLQLINDKGLKLEQKIVKQ